MRSNSGGGWQRAADNEQEHERMRQSSAAAPPAHHEEEHDQQPIEHETQGPTAAAASAFATVSLTTPPPRTAATTFFTASSCDNRAATVRGPTKQVASRQMHAHALTNQHLLHDELNTSLYEGGEEELEVDVGSLSSSGIPGIRTKRHSYSALSTSPYSPSVRGGGGASSNGATSASTWPQPSYASTSSAIVQPAVASASSSSSPSTADFSGMSSNTAASAPLHSYPHLNFPLPRAFVEERVRTMLRCTRPMNDPSSSSCADANATTTIPEFTSGDPLPFNLRLSFRAFHVSDTTALSALHDALFPVRYDQRFYQELLLNDKVTLLAFLEVQDNPQYQRPQPSGKTASARDSSPPSASTSSSPWSQPLLIGVATGKIGESHHHLHCRRMMSGYIITLGVAQGFRKIGLGRFLLKHIIRLIRESDPRCVRIQLHMKDGNTGALRLYESYGFHVVEVLPEHYQIQGINYTALRLIKHVDPTSSLYEENDTAAAPRPSSDRWIPSWCNVM